MFSLSIEGAQPNFRDKMYLWSESACKTPRNLCKRCHAEVTLRNFGNVFTRHFFIKFFFFMFTILTLVELNNSAGIVLLVVFFLFTFFFYFRAAVTQTFSFCFCCYKIYSFFITFQFIFFIPFLFKPIPVNVLICDGKITMLSW